jgi:hypothetical protein
MQQLQRTDATDATVAEDTRIVAVCPFLCYILTTLRVSERLQDKKRDRGQEGEAEIDKERDRGREKEGETERDRASERARERD